MVLKTSDMHRDLTRTGSELQQDQRCSRNSGEHRLPACCFRQPAEKPLNVHLQSFFCNVGVSSASCRRLQAGSLRSPEDSSHLNCNLQKMIDHVSAAIPIAFHWLRSAG